MMIGDQRFGSSSQWNIELIRIAAPLMDNPNSEFPFHQYSGWTPIRLAVRCANAEVIKIIGMGREHQNPEYRASMSIKTPSLSEYELWLLF